MLLVLPAHLAGEDHKSLTMWDKPLLGLELQYKVWGGERQCTGEKPSRLTQRE
jgi:hypothetical protein